MGNLGRVVITSLAALLIGAYAYGTAFDSYGTTLGDILHSPALGWAFLALLILTVAVVNRWWVVAVAFVPFAVWAFLHSATDYVYPYHEDPYPALALMGTVFLLCILSLGFLLRALFDRTVSDTWLTRVRGKFAGNGP